MHHPALDRHRHEVRPIIHTVDATNRGFHCARFHGNNHPDTLMFPLYDDQPIRRTPVVTIAIIILNVFVFVWWQQSEGVDQSVALAGFVPWDFSNHQPGAMTHLMTSMFMHAGWMHLLGNMWFLWIFGKAIEDLCGPIRYACFYLLSGAAAALLYAYGSPTSDIPMVGASGAISGVLGAFLLKYPKSNVRALTTFIVLRLVDVPAYFFLLLWIGMQLFFQLANHSREGGGVAYLAHIGGFIAGIVLIFIFQENGAPPRSSQDDSW
jgi:membrane associated rhomboid family serine protease